MSTPNFPRRVSGKLLDVLGRIPASEFQPSDLDLSQTTRSNWMSELVRLGFVERLSFGKYRVSEPEFVAACRRALEADPKLSRTFGQARLLPFLAAHTAQGGIAPLQRASGLFSYQWASAAENLVREGWIEPVDATRTRLKSISPEVRDLIQNYRELLVRKGPSSNCIHQSGCEAAWVVGRVPADWPMLPAQLVSPTPKALSGSAIFYRGFRRLNELDWLLLAAKAADNASWREPWTPSRLALVAVASRLTLNQSLSTGFRDHAALYGSDDLSERVLHLQLAWSGFPDAVTDEPRRDLTPIAWHDTHEGQHRSRYGVLAGYASPTERRPLMRRSSR